MTGERWPWSTQPTICIRTPPKSKIIFFLTRVVEGLLSFLSGVLKEIVVVEYVGVTGVF